MAEARGQPQARPQPEPDPDGLAEPAASGSASAAAAAAVVAAATAADAAAAAAAAATTSVEEGHGLPAVVSSLATATDPLADKPPSQSQAQVSTPQTYGRVQVELHPQRPQLAEPQHHHHHHHQVEQSHQLYQQQQEQLLQQQLRLEDAADVEAHTPSLYGVTEEVGAKEEIEHNHNNSADANNFTATTSTPLSASVITIATSTVAAEPISSVLTNGVPLPDEHQQSNSSVPPSPSPSAMSNPPQHPGHPRQPVGFPSPTYNSHMNAHYGYGNPAGQSVDPYRGSPVSTPGNNPMSLPSMRTFDPVQQAQSQQGPMAAQMMQVQAGMSYYAQPVPLPGNPYGLPPEAMGPRYVLPPNDPRTILTGPRGKKEIKRRTKTGCLTCRKRRIKCDEQHPVCKNCQKSKRECLGYDPIFKQQQQHPTNIQPAPNHPAPSISVPSNGPPSAAPSASNAVATYTSLPSVLSSSYNSSASSSVANLVPTIKSENFDYGPAIDPALDGVGPTSSTSASHFPAMKPVAAPSPLDQRMPITTPRLRGGGPPSTPFRYHNHPASQFAPSPYYPQTPTYTASPAKKMRVDELVALGGASLPRAESPPSKDKLDEIQALYAEIYAPGLVSFFESKWFTKDYAISALLGSASVLDMLAGFLSAVSNTNVNDSAAMNYSANLEFRVVWGLTCLAYTREAPVNNYGDLPAEDDSVEIRNRVAVMDALLAGDYLEHNPLQPPTIRGDYHRIREFEFWYNLAEFIRVKEIPNTDMTPQRDQILGKLRTVLDGRENRDVLYSIAVMRAYAPNFPPDFESTLPSHLDEGDPKSKLAVARKFIQDEARVTGGTTNIVRRFSELAARAFISPGGNVPRPSYSGGVRKLTTHFMMEHLFDKGRPSTNPGYSHQDHHHHHRPHRLGHRAAAEVRWNVSIDS